MSTTLGPTQGTTALPRRNRLRRMVVVQPRLRSAWTVGTAALVVYLFVVHSYKINIGAAVLAVGLFVTMLHERPIRFTTSWYWYAGFLGWSLLFVPGSVDPGMSFNQWIEQVKILLIMFLALNAIRTPQQHRLITLAWLGMFALYPVRGTLFNFLYGNSTGGRYGWNYVFSNFNDMAALSLIPLAMSIERLRSSDKKWVKVAAGFGVISLPFIILITQSRAGEMGLAVMFLFLLARSRYRMRLASAIAVIGVLAVLLAPKGVWDRIQGMSYLTSVETLGLSDSSAEQRYVIWQVAEKIIADNPVTGTGIGTYPVMHEFYARNRPEWAIAMGPRDTHSTYLHVLAEGGVIGFAIFMMVFLSAYYELMKTARALKNSTSRIDQEIRDRCQVYQAAYAGLAICCVFGSMQGMVFPFLFASMGAAALRAYKSPTIRIA